MAEDARSRTAMRDIEELLSSNASAINTSVDSKVAAVDSKIAAVDSKIAALDTKLEKKLSEMFDAMRLISSSCLFTGEGSSPPPIIEERQFPPIFDPGGQRLATPFQHPDSSRFRFEMEDWQEGRPSTYGSDALPCSNCFHDPISEMKALQQIDSLQDYYSRFESIQSRITLPEELLLGWFISGLRNETRREVRTFRPKTVMQAYAIGRLYEAAHPVNSIGDSSHSVSPQQPLHQTIPPFLQSIDEESNQQEDEGVCVVLTDSCILFEIVESDIAEIGIEQTEKDDEFEAENKVESSRSNVPNTFFTLDAYQLFDEMPETVLELKTISCATLGISIADRLKKYGFISLTFDPGGENHKRLAEFEEQFGEHCKLKSVDMRVEQAESEDENQLEGNSENVQNMATTHYASKLFDEMSRPSVECVLIAEVDGGNRLMVPTSQDSFVHHVVVDRLVFDPGGQLGTETDEQVMKLEFTVIGLIVSSAEIKVAQDFKCFAKFIAYGLLTIHGGDKLNGQLNFPFQWDPGRVTHALLDPNGFLKCSLVWVDSGLFGHRFTIGSLLSLMHFLLQSKLLKVTIFDPGGAYVLPKYGSGTESYYLHKLPIHWDPGGTCLWHRDLLLLTPLTIKGVGIEAEVKVAIVQRDPRGENGQKLYAEFKGFLPQSKPFKLMVFEWGGEIYKRNPKEFEGGFAWRCEWSNCWFRNNFNHQNTLSMHWDPGGGSFLHNLLLACVGCDVFVWHCIGHIVNSKAVDHGWSILGKVGGEKREVMKAEIVEFMMRVDPLVAAVFKLRGVLLRLKVVDHGGCLLLNWAQLCVHPMPWRIFVLRGTEVVVVSPYPGDAKSMCAADFLHGHYLFSMEWCRRLFLEDICMYFQQKLLPIHWDPGGCFHFMRSAKLQATRMVYTSNKDGVVPTSCWTSVVLKWELLQAYQRYYVVYLPQLKGDIGAASQVLIFYISFPIYNLEDKVVGRECFVTGIILHRNCYIGLIPILVNIVISILSFHLNVISLEFGVCQKFVREWGEALCVNTLISYLYLGI